ELRIPLQRLHDVLKGKRAVSLDTALRLARYFGTSAEVWLNLQTRYDLERAEDDALPERIAREVRPGVAQAG
ncbi:MAG: HigA family addiction module antidote protein, partial [Desulfovibrio sp.]|nr:HigA family addiction module antidote protein [Desulfovibrio sp.]